MGGENVEGIIRRVVRKDINLGIERLEINLDRY